MIPLVGAGDPPADRRPDSVRADDHVSVLNAPVAARIHDAALGQKRRRTEADLVRIPPRALARREQDRVILGELGR